MFPVGSVQSPFLFLAIRGLIIRDASAYGVLAPVSLPTAERAAKVSASCIPWMGEEQYVAMPASLQALSQVGLLLEHGPDSPVILGNNTANLLLAVPVRNELKTRLYLYYKKAKC